MKITKNQTLKEIFDLPGGEKVLSTHGVPCVSCPMAQYELNQLTLMDVCNIYGLNLDGILADLNKPKSKK